MHKIRAMTTTPRFLSTAETAEALGVERSTISRWITAGRITPAMRLTSGAYLFAPAEVDRVRATLQAAS